MKYLLMILALMLAGVAVNPVRAEVGDIFVTDDEAKQIGDEWRAKRGLPPVYSEAENKIIRQKSAEDKPIKEHGNHHKSPSLSVARTSDKTGIVQGDPSLVLKFYLAWQTEVWPGFFQVKGKPENTELLNAVQSASEGKITLWIGSDVQLKAFKKVEDLMLEAK